MSSRLNLPIQGLRGFLASFVVLYHVYAGMANGGYFDGINHLYWQGKMAVFLFFAISGYLIIQSLIKSQSISKFLKNRIFRIYPVFFVIHILIFGIGPIVNYEFLAEITPSEYVFHFFTNLLLLPGIFKLPIAQIVAWSLSYEFFFYLIAAFFYLAKSKIYIFKNKKIFTAFLIIGIIPILIYFPYMYYFLMGVIVFKYEKQIHRLTQKLPKSVLDIISITSLLGAFIIVSYSYYVAILVSFIFFVTVVEKVGVVSRIFSTKLMVYLGSISYSLYLWHTFVMFPFKHTAFKIFENPYLIMFSFGVPSIVLSLIISHFSYKLIEKKFVNWFKDYEKTKKQKYVFQEKQYKHP